MENLEKKFGLGSLLRGFASGVATGLGLEVAGELYSFAKSRLKTEKKRVSAVVVDSEKPN
jgi:hypothetical protein